MEHSPASLKGVINDLIQSLSRLFRIIVPVSLVDKEVRAEYDSGLEEVEINVGMNFTRNPRQYELLRDYVVNNIKDASDQTQDKLRQIITRSVVENKPLSEVQADVKELFEATRERAKMIARTELSRARNLGHLEGARQSKLRLKKWVLVKEDERTSGICMAMHNKYGSEEQAIPLEENFEAADVSAQAPPFHVNCRSRLMTVQEEE